MFRYPRARHIEQAQKQVSDGLNDREPASKSDAEELRASEGKPNGRESKTEMAAMKAKRKGHGRKAADKYPGAGKVECRNVGLKAGDPCPEPGCLGRVLHDVEWKLPKPSDWNRIRPLKPRPSLIPKGTL